jgi:hypothetical protein
MRLSSVSPPSPDQLAARRQLDEARQRLRDRKRDARRKIIAGAALLAEAERNPEICRIVRRVLMARVTRPIDRAVLGDLIEG